MKNRHGPKGGRGSSIYRSSRRGDERVIRTGAEIADFNGDNSDDDQNEEDDDDDGEILHRAVFKRYLSHS
jgi:hypothetical protein